MRLKLMASLVEKILGVTSDPDNPRADMFLNERILSIGMVNNNSSIKKAAENFEPLFPIKEDNEPDVHALYAVQFPDPEEDKEPDVHALYAVQMPEPGEDKEPDIHALYAVQLPEQPTGIVKLPDEPDVHALYAVQMPDLPSEPIKLPILKDGNTIQSSIQRIREFLQKFLEGFRAKEED